VSVIAKYGWIVFLLLVLYGLYSVVVAMSKWNISLEMWLIILIFLILTGEYIKRDSKIRNGGFG